MFATLLTTAALAQVAYGLVHSLGSGGNCLGVSGTPANGSPVILGACNTMNGQMQPTQQQWVISPGNNPAVQLFGTSLCLDAGPNPTPGRAATVATCQNSATQAWYLTDDNRIAVTGGTQCLEGSGTTASTGNCAPNIAAQAWTPVFLFNEPTSTSASASSASASASSAAGGAGGVVGGVTQSGSSVASGASSMASSVMSGASSAASGASSVASSAGSAGASAASGVSATGASATSGAGSVAGAATSGAGSVAGAATSGAGSVAGGATSAAGGATSVAGSVAGAASSAVTGGRSAGFAQSPLPSLGAIAGLVFGAVWLF